MNITGVKTLIASNIVIAIVLLVLRSFVGGQAPVWIVIALVLSTVAAVVTIGRLKRELSLQAVRSILEPGESLTPPESTEEALRVLRDRGDALRQKIRKMDVDREQLAAVLSSMTEGVIAIDRSEKIVVANEGSRAAMNESAGEVVGRPFRECVRSVQIHDLVRSALKTRKPDPIECELINNRIVTVAAAVIGDDAPRGAVVTIHDISDLRRLERIRQEFVANISHELKTPVTAIQACGETLSNGAIDDPPAARRFLQRIDEQCDRLAELITDMLHLARIESGKEMLEIQSVDLERVMRDCARHREQMASANQLSISVDVQCEPFSIESDLTSIDTLLGNLADNAIKYTEPGGSVVLELDRTHDSAVIRVRDTGIGIERQHINRIFQRFYRVDSARSRGSGGSGLGLAIVKHLSQLLGGHVHVDSQQRVGTTFSVTLPLVLASATS